MPGICGSFETLKQRGRDPARARRACNWVPYPQPGQDARTHTLTLTYCEITKKTTKNGEKDSVVNPAYLRLIPAQPGYFRLLRFAIGTFDLVQPISPDTQEEVQAKCARDAGRSE